MHHAAHRCSCRCRRAQAWLGRFHTADLADALRRALLAPKADPDQNEVRMARRAARALSDSFWRAGLQVPAVVVVLKVDIKLLHNADPHLGALMASAWARTAAAA